eukprot:15457326-Alexandrium_andersonii.AAC.1
MDFTASPATPKTPVVPPKYLPAAKYLRAFKGPTPDASKMKNINAVNLEPTASPPPSAPGRAASATSKGPE